MIISASRRTDIPKWYSKWFMNRIRAGYAAIRNPFNYDDPYIVSLRPEDVDVIVFWTRDTRRFIEQLDELDKRGYRYYFQYTITGYPEELEGNNPPLDQAIETFSELSDRVGAGRVIWRYDPIVFTDLMNVDWHERNFKEICQQLRGKTERVVISFVDFYKRTELNFKKLNLVDGYTYKKVLCDEEIDSEVECICRSVASFAEENKMIVQSCAERDLSAYGVMPGMCVDNQLIARLFPELRTISNKKKSETPEIKTLSKFQTREDSKLL
jgi:hypothetical protein